MFTPILATKLYVPPPRPNGVQRPRLIERLNTGLFSKLTLISAPAGFGKTTLVSKWIAEIDRPVAWLSLDEADNNPTRFLTYLIAALQTIEPEIGASVMNALQSQQEPPPDAILTTILNDIASVPAEFLLVLDDYHLTDSQTIDEALAFLLEYQPPQMHLVIATREDPPLPLARLRARGQLSEIRVADLRFTPSEAADFLNQSMGLNLTETDVAALEARTEGWIAGLQLAALAMQRPVNTNSDNNINSFIQSFTGGHHFVLDYLVEEVLNQQPEHIQKFLLQTSILDRLSGPLCDALLPQSDAAGQMLLEYVEQANLFLIPLDSQRRWYRYHHLFAELLRQRLAQSSSSDGNSDTIQQLHIRASQWFEDNGLELEAFQHAAAASDVQRAAKLIDGHGIPLYFRGAVTPILHWIETLSRETLNTVPSLWVSYGWVLMRAYQNIRVPAMIEAAEAVLPATSTDEATRDLIGQIAAIRAMLAANTYQIDEIIAQSHKALDLLHPENLYVRAVVLRSLAIAYQFRGERTLAKETYEQAIVLSEQTGNVFVNILSTTGLGIIQLSDNALFQAEDSYKQVLDLIGDPNLPIACAAFSGLSGINYQWNNLKLAQEQAEHGIHLARQIDTIDSSASGQLFLAKIKLAQGDIDGANADLSEVEQIIHQRNFDQLIPELTEARARLLLALGDVEATATLVANHDIPITQASVLLAQENGESAFTLLEPLRQQFEAQGWADKILQVVMLQALALNIQGEKDGALHLLNRALELAEPGGIIRIFLDEGTPMQQLLLLAKNYGIKPDYVSKLLAAFDSIQSTMALPSDVQPLLEPLSDRELEVLRLVADGLSNRQICEKLFLAMDTVKGHNRRIYGKLQVQRRTEAVARARELRLI